MLAVRTASTWVTWWRSDASPSRWDGSAPLATYVIWHPGAGGTEWGELKLRGKSEAWHTRVVVVRLDPRRVELALVPAFTQRENWSLAQVDRDVAIALERERVGQVREAFQSYPMLLEDGVGVIPEPLRKSGKGADLSHRDARLALGTLADGRVLVALTRFDALGRAFGRIPFGLTSPEMAAVMGALGCREALLLDGGISGQLLVRQPNGSVRTWPGTRSVPLGLVARPRE